MHKGNNPFKVGDWVTVPKKWPQHGKDTRHIPSQIFWTREMDDIEGVAKKVINNFYEDRCQIGSAGHGWWVPVACIRLATEEEIRVATLIANVKGEG